MSEFTKGLIVRKPHDKAPNFVKFNLSFKVEEFIPFLQENAVNGWVNAQILEKKTKDGFYAAVDDWEPNKDNQQNISETIERNAPKQEEESNDDLPF